MLSPDDSRVEAYLRGEEIALEEKKGYAVLYCGSCPLGGVKISGGRGKNLYPKGLRKV
jgi:NOL1/NOP2/fmu family ribosome biogenesis protein